MGLRVAGLVAGAWLLSGCAFQAGSRAGDPAPGTHSSPIDLTDVQEVDGKIVRIDGGKHLFVATAAGEVQVTANEATGIFSDGAAVKLGELKEGTQVRASFEERDGVKIAKWIEVPRLPGEKGADKPDGKKTQADKK